MRVNTAVAAGRQRRRMGIRKSLESLNPSEFFFGPTTGVVAPGLGPPLWGTTFIVAE
jgi:hypothetical protein